MGNKHAHQCEANMQAQQLVADSGFLVNGAPTLLGASPESASVRKICLSKFVCQKKLCQNVTVKIIMLKWICQN